MKCLRLAVQLLVCSCVGVHVTSAQVIDLSSSSGRRVVDGASAGVRAGAWLAVGDVTGDYWHKELIAGTPDESGGRGAVRVFITRPQAAQSMLTSADVLLTGGTAGDRFGFAVDAGYVTQQEVQIVNGSPVGTINPRDLLVGAPGAQGGRGAVYVFRGPFALGSTRTTADAMFTIVGAAPGDNLGSLIESADLNGDRFREVLLAVPSRGVVYVIDLRAVTTTMVDLSIVPPATLISGLGGSIALATGDVTGDGVFDLAVGAPDALGARGAVYLVRGRVGPLPTTIVLPAQADAQLAGIDTGDRFGAALAIVDVDVFRDVSAELLIGAPSADGPANTRPDAGEVSIVLGRPDIISAFTPALTLIGAAPGDRLGTQVTAGFVTRRTPADIVMLAAGANGGNGEVFAYFGRDRSVLPRGSLDLATSASRRIVSDEAAGPIQSVRVWEVTGEGAEEIVVGVPSAMSTAGRLYIALSPRLDLTATTVSLRAMQCVPAVREITIENPSMIAVPWQLSAAPNWIQTSPASGTTVLGAPGRFRLVVDTSGLAPGTYSHRLEFSSRGPDLSYTIPLDVQVTVDPSTPLARTAHVDFNGDGCGDPAIFRPSTSGLHVPGRPELRWGLPGDVPVPGDYDGDRIAEFAIYRPSNGTWYLSGSQVQWGDLGDMPVPADYDGDGRMDIAVYRPSSGRWFIRGQAAVDWGGPGSVPVPADYDGDGRAQPAIFVRGSGVWHVRDAGTFFFGVAGDLPVPADYDGDGRADIAIYRPGSALWSVRGQFSITLGEPGDLPVPMDMTRDGRADPVLYRRATGSWLVHVAASNLTITKAWGAAGDLPAYPLTAVLSTTAADFNSDGRSEIAVWRPGNGTWYLRQSNTQFSTISSMQWGVPSLNDAPLPPADYDGDRSADIAVWRPSTGVWHVLLSAQRFTQQLAIQWGSAGSRDVPVPADYDGDRRSDIAMWRPAEGTWHVLMSSSQFTRPFVIRWGSAGDIPLPGDYDGDGRADLAVWRPADGTWYVLTSSAGYDNEYSQKWGGGNTGDIPLAGDFDGDSRTDLALWRPSTGAWLVRLSGSGYADTFSMTWGWPIAGDRPVLGDYDGDGRTDIAVWRPGDGNWYVRTSTSSYAGFFVVQWGVSALRDVVIDGGMRPGAAPAVSSAPPPPVPARGERARSDFNRDGRLDLVWQHQSTGQLIAWHMNGAAVIESRFLTPDAVGAGWKLKGSGDLNRDGKADFVWQHATTGELAYWLMDGTVQSGMGWLTPGRVDPIWQIAAVRDLNADGSADIIWQHSTTSQVLAWYMNGTQMVGSAWLNPTPHANANWKLRGLADFSGDGQADLVWHNVANGQVLLWVMNGSTVVSAVPTSPAAVAQGWSLVAVGDANLDGAPDIFWEHETTGQIVVWAMVGAQTVSAPLIGTVDPSWKISAPR